MYYRLYISKLAIKKLSEITTAIAQELYDEVSDRVSIATANRMIVTFRAMFNRASARNMFNGKNPCENIEMGKEKARTRFLQPEEMQAFFESVNTEDNADIRDYVLISLFTAQVNLDLVRQAMSTATEAMFEAATGDNNQIKPHTIFI